MAIQSPDRFLKERDISPPSTSSSFKPEEGRAEGGRKICSCHPRTFCKTAANMLCFAAPCCAALGMGLLAWLRCCRKRQQVQPHVLEVQKDSPLKDKILIGEA